VVAKLRAVANTEPVEIVCFDLGGVLVRIRTAWAELCQAAKLDVRGNSAGKDAELAVRDLIRAHQLGELSTEAWAAAVAAALHGLYTPAEITALHEVVIIEEYPGIGALIDDLHRAGVATACLSNTNDAHWATLLHSDGVQPLPGERRYPNICRLGSHHASHLMRLTKPSCAIYRAFEAATGRSGPQILFFDDLAENVAGARALGWRAEQIDPTLPTDAQMRRHLVAHGVPPLLKASFQDCFGNE
jgi:glucose-1-phosphatase